MNNRDQIITIVNNLHNASGTCVSPESVCNHIDARTDESRRDVRKQLDALVDDYVLDRRMVGNAYGYLPMGATDCRDGGAV